MDLPTTALSRRIDPLLTRIGEWISWLWVVLLAIIVLNVVLRYAFGEGRIEFEELQWHLYSTGFLLGLGYAYQADAHIRDTFYPWIDALTPEIEAEWKQTARGFLSLILLLDQVPRNAHRGTPSMFTHDARGLARLHAVLHAVPAAVNEQVVRNGMPKLGTDFPVLRFERTVQEIDDLGLKPEVRRKFMRDNAIRIYGLEDRIQ